MSLCVVHWLRASIKLWFISHLCRYCCFSTNFDMRKTCWTFGNFFSFSRKPLATKKIFTTFFSLLWWMSGIWNAFSLQVHQQRDERDTLSCHSSDCAYIYFSRSDNICFSPSNLHTLFTLIQFTMNAPLSTGLYTARCPQCERIVFGFSYLHCNCIRSHSNNLFNSHKTKQNKTHTIVWWNSHGE